MRNFLQSGESPEFVAPYDVVAGAGFLVGGIFAVAADAASSGAAVIGKRNGVFTLAKVGSQAWAIGDKVYWDNSNKRCTKTANGNTFVGFAFAVAGSGSDVTTGTVLLVPSGDQLKVACGMHTTVTATDTVVTGLALVTAAVAGFETDVGDANQYAQAVVGDQAGAPAAGSIVIKTWKTSGTDPTPIAADAFSKLVSWIAVGR